MSMISKLPVVLCCSLSGVRSMAHPAPEKKIGKTSKQVTGDYQNTLGNIQLRSLAPLILASRFMRKYLTNLM
jgi:hypothetical protein